MSTVTPPATSPLTQPVALPRAVIISAPPPLLTLGVGAKIEAAVAQLTDTSQIRLTTNFGDVTVRLSTRIPVTIGQPLLLQLLTSGEQPRVQISLPNGQPLTPQNGVPTGVSGPSQSGGAGTAATTPIGQSIVPGAQISATLLRPINLTPALNVIPTSQPSVSQGILPTVAGSGSATATPQPASAQGAAPSATSGQAGTATLSGTTQQVPTPAQGNVTAPAGSTLTLKVVSFTLPAKPESGIQLPKTGGTVSLAPGATLSGVVSGKQGVAQTVVQTHAGPVSLPTTEVLPKGTQITFEVSQLNVSKPSGNHDLGTIRPLGSASGGQWPALTDSLDVLGDLAPAAQAQLLQAALPRADAQLSTNILFFLAALRGGDLKGWMGDGPLRILDRQRPDLAGRLRDDLGQLSRLVDDPNTGEWRMHVVPYLNNDELDRIRLLVRDRDADNDDENAPGGSRFVIDLNLSRMGHLQIDGLIGNNGKRVDVVLRSDAPLSGTMRDDIRALYANAIEVTGIEGTVGFQAAPAGFVNVPDATPHPGEGVIV